MGHGFLGLPVLSLNASFPRSAVGDVNVWRIMDDSDDDDDDGG
jgi:hypothetical protein